jgi:hypothetical protein
VFLSFSDEVIRRRYFVPDFEIRFLSYASCELLTGTNHASPHHVGISAENVGLRFRGTVMKRESPGNR